LGVFGALDGVLVGQFGSFWTTRRTSSHNRAAAREQRETRARTGQESDPTPLVGQRVIGDDPELLERVDPGGTDGAQMIRDNPRVPWALRDLCNPWTWAYSAFRDPDGNAFSVTETA